MPYISHEAASAFSSLSTTSYCVLVTHPAGHPWYVVLDRKTAEPVYETDSSSAAASVADKLTSRSDLEFLASTFTRRTELFTHSTFNIDFSSDGLELFTPEMLLCSGELDLKGSTDDTSRLLPTHNLWHKASFDNTPLIENPKSFIYSFEVNRLIIDEEGETVNDTKEAYVLANLNWSEDGDLEKANIKVLDEQALVNGVPLWKLLNDIERSPTHQIYFENRRELEDWKDVADKMPLFSARLGPDLDRRVYAYEGGPVLEKLAVTHPDLVERDGNGEPIPLRVKIVPESELFSEDGMLADQAMVASHVLKDALEGAARIHAVRQNSRNGLATQAAFGTMQFITIARMLNRVELEVLSGQPDTPDDASATGRIHYRLWVDNECLLDSKPGRKGVFSPLRLDTPRVTDVMLDAGGRPALTAAQVGQLLRVAVAPGGIEDTGFSQRTVNFLRSEVAEQLRATAASLMSGEALLIDGKVVPTVLSAMGLEGPHTPEHLGIR